jgi:hypothetical protein
MRRLRAGHVSNCGQGLGAQGEEGHMAISKDPPTQEGIQIRKSTAGVAEPSRGSAKATQESADDVMARTRSRADQIGTAMGETLQSAAKAVRRYTPQEGTLGSAGTAVADRLEGAGLYLEEENLAAMAQDVVGLIRRYPLQSLLIAATAGFLLARMRK